MSQTDKVTVMGIDASLTATACVTLEYRPDTPGEMIPANLEIKTVKRGVERLLYIERLVMEEIERYKPSLVVLEGYAYNATNQAHQIGELGGVLRRALYLAKVNLKEIPPAKVKKFATGKGNAPKEQVMLAVLRRWGWPAGSTHEADAYTLARMAAALTGRMDGLNIDQRGIVVNL